MAFGRHWTETGGVGVTWKPGLPGGDLAESGQALEEKSSCITAAARFGPVVGGANGVKKVGCGKAGSMYNECKSLAGWLSERVRWRRSD